MTRNEKADQLTREYVAKMRELDIPITKVQVIRDGREELYKSEDPQAKAADYERMADDCRTREPDIAKVYLAKARAIREGS